MVCVIIWQHQNHSISFLALRGVFDMPKTMSYRLLQMLRAKRSETKCMTLHWQGKLIRFFMPPSKSAHSGETFCNVLFIHQWTNFCHSHPLISDTMTFNASFLLLKFLLILFGMIGSSLGCQAGLIGPDPESSKNALAICSWHCLYVEGAKLPDCDQNCSFCG